MSLVMFNLSEVLGVRYLNNADKLPIQCVNSDLFDLCYIITKVSQDRDRANLEVMYTVIDLIVKSHVRSLEHKQIAYRETIGSWCYMARDALNEQYNKTLYTLDTISVLKPIISQIGQWILLELGSVLRTVITYKSFFLRWGKCFSKGRYARARQQYRAGVYWCLYLNLAAVVGLSYWFYRVTFKFSYCWWIVYSCILCVLVSKVVSFYGKPTYGRSVRGLLSISALASNLRKIVTLPYRADFLSVLYYVIRGFFSGGDKKLNIAIYFFII